MSAEEAILELLKVHNRVIVPGFGAFLVAKDDSAEKPYVLFNGFLSFNDGLLVDYLAEKNGVDALVAADYSTEYVYKIKTALQEEKIYKFNSLGTFDFDESGVMRFRYNPNIGKMPQKPGAHYAKPTPKAELKKDVKTEKKPEVKVETKKEETPKSIDEKVELKAELEKPTLSPSDDLLNIDNSSSPSVIIDATPSISNSINADVKKSSFELDEDKEPITKEKVKKVEKVEKKVSDPSDYSSTSSKGRAVFIITSILILLLLIGGYFYFYYLPQKAQALALQQEMEQAVKLKQERIKFQSDSLAAIKAHELALADSLSKIEEQAIKSGYSLIIGAFAEEKNANNLLAKVRDRFPKAQIISYRNRFLVSVDAFTSKSEAEIQLGNVVKSLETDCWIHRN